MYDELGFPFCMIRKKTISFCNKDRNQLHNYNSIVKKMINTEIFKLQIIRNTTASHSLLPGRSKKSRARGIYPNMSSLRQTGNVGHRIVRFSSINRYVKFE